MAQKHRWMLWLAAVKEENTQQAAKRRKATSAKITSVSSCFGDVMLALIGVIKIKLQAEARIGRVRRFLTWSSFTWVDTQLT